MTSHNPFSKLKSSLLSNKKLSDEDAAKIQQAILEKQTKNKKIDKPKK